MLNHPDDIIYDCDTCMNSGTQEYISHRFGWALCPECLPDWVWCSGCETIMLRSEEVGEDNECLECGTITEEIEHD